MPSKFQYKQQIKTLQTENKQLEELLMKSIDVLYLAVMVNSK